MKCIALAGLAVWLVACPASGVVAPGGGFDRYAVILEREPFGRAPAPVVPMGPVVPPADSFSTYIRMTAIIREDDGRIRVGFVNRKEKDKSFILAVGEKVDDYELLAADLENELARLRKGGETQWLSMKAAGAAMPPPGWVGDGAAAGPVQTGDIRAAPPAPALADPALVRRQTRYAAIRRAEMTKERTEEAMRQQAKLEEVLRPPPPDDESTDDEDDEELEIRLAQAANAADDEEWDDDDDEDWDDGDVIEVPPDWDDDDDADEDLDEDDEEELIREAEIQAHLQRYQKELIRQGLPPLPIQLTPESDDELVREGVLPAVPEGGVPADDEDDGDDGEDE